MSNTSLKQAAAKAALELLPRDEIIGIGTGSTVNCLIDALAETSFPVAAVVSSSEASSQRLTALGFNVIAANTVERLAVYVDGADEITAQGYMTKGGGAALTREKIVADLAEQFICIADESKLVKQLGKFPIPVEIIPMALGQISRRFAAMGGRAVLRERDAQAVVTDNGLTLVDVHDLLLEDPLTFEQTVNQWPGVVTVGVFAQHRAHKLCLASQHSVVIREMD